MGFYALTLLPCLCTNSFKNDQFAPFSFLNIRRDKRLFFSSSHFVDAEGSTISVVPHKTEFTSPFHKTKENLWYSELNQKWLNKQKHLSCNYDHTGGFYIIMLLCTVDAFRVSSHITLRINYPFIFQIKVSLLASFSFHPVNNTWPGHGGRAHPSRLFLWELPQSVTLTYLYKKAKFPLYMLEAVSPKSSIFLGKRGKKEIFGPYICFPVTLFVSQTNIFNSCLILWIALSRKCP